MNARDWYGHRPLIITCDNRNLDIVGESLMLKHKDVDVKVSDDKGRTPLAFGRVQGR